ncbi:isochorismatase family protein [Nonomuraea sp. NPDC046802]|uniref:isochorismatase family protein n=1 Tax=Nonomuraea sp. NPDC046802 TaxID=3154919 RepID=UPI0033F6087F
MARHPALSRPCPCSRNSTARAAYEHGYNVTLVTDAMTDRDAEAHRHSMERIFPLLGESGSTALLAKTRA